MPVGSDEYVSLDANINLNVNIHISNCRPRAICDPNSSTAICSNNASTKSNWWTRTNAWVSRVRVGVTLILTMFTFNLRIEMWRCHFDICSIYDTECDIRTDFMYSEDDSGGVVRCFQPSELFLSC